MTKHKSQITFDEYNWVLHPEDQPNKIELARRDLLQLMDRCDACPYRATLNDTRQEVCWSCPCRLQMEEAAKNVEMLTARVRQKRRKIQH